VENYTLDPIEDAIEAIKNGEVIIVVDDEDRENEGDFVCAAEKVTPEIINFMATHGRGLICAPLIEDRCEKLGLDLYGVRRFDWTWLYDGDFNIRSSQDHPSIGG